MGIVAQQDYEGEQFHIVHAPAAIARVLYKVAHLTKERPSYKMLFVREEDEHTVLVATDMVVAVAARTPSKLPIEPGDYRFYHKNVKYGTGETHMLVRKDDPPRSNIFSIFVDPDEREQIGTCHYRTHLRLNTFASVRINVDYLKLLTEDLFTIYTDRRPTVAPRYQFEGNHFWSLTYLVMALDPKPETALDRLAQQK